MRWRRHRWAACALALCAASTAFAQGSSSRADSRGAALVIGRIAHDSQGTVRGQLVKALCGPLPCRPLASVQRAGRLDWNALHRAGEVLLDGQLIRKRRSESVLIRLRDGKTHVLGRFGFPLRKGRLSDENLASLQEGLAMLLGTSPRTPAPTPLKPSPIPFPNPQPAPGAPPPPGPPPGQAISPPPLGAAKPPPIALPHLKWMAASVGVSLLNISLRWHALRSGNLRPYHAATAFAPVVAFQVFPLAHALKNWARGFGLYARYTFVVGLKSSIPGGPKLPTHYDVFDLRAKLRLQPFSNSPFLFEPLVGLRLSSFSINAVDGAVVVGLPNLAYRGPEVGFGASYPLWRFHLLGRALFFPRLAAGEILSASFFPQGSLWGFDFALGADYPLVDGISLRAWFSFTDYEYGFSVPPDAAYQANGATGRYLAGRLMVRYAF